MRTSILTKIIGAIGFTAALSTAGLGCTGDDKDMSASPVGAAGSSGNEDLPPSTPDDICQSIATFPGWAKLGAAPQTDAAGEQTVWYVAIPARSNDEVSAISAAGVPSEFIESTPLLQDQSTDAGTPDPGQKYLCWEPAGAEIEWALVPGGTLNQIIQTQAAAMTPTWEAIVLLPLPSQVADPALTFDGAHPLSAETAQYIGF